MTTKTPDPIAAEIARYYDDPYGFVMDCFPWGEPGPLQDQTGPDENQTEFLNALAAEVKQRNYNGINSVLPIRMAETSGHNTGKSAMGAWLTWWVISTRARSIGTVTAGSYDQLEEKTWAAILWWGKMCVTRHWFELQAHGIYSLEDPEAWKVTAQSCKEENHQNFAGQHARGSTSWYLFDEASEVPTKIWETAYGGLGGDHDMIFAWGQMVRNTGEFYEVCYGNKRDRWNHRRVDSRTSRFTNKETLEQEIGDYGIDSDYVRVRILGYAPSASELQYIDRIRVDAARRRVVYSLPDEPLVAGFDVSGGGRAWNVIRFRRGYDGRVREPIRIPGEKDPDRSQRVAICAELLGDRRPETRVSALFVDSAFGAPIVERLKMLGHGNVFEVNFGAESPDPHFGNKRAWMYGQLKEWLMLGGVPDEEELATQLCLPGYHIKPGGSKLMLESKADIQKRGEKSPDDADALALTFAMKVYSPPPQKPKPMPRPTQGSWMG